MEDTGSRRKIDVRDILLYISLVLVVSLLFVCSSVAQLKEYIIPDGAITPGTAPATGAGSVDKVITVEKEGWYELFVDAAPWPTDFSLDGQLIAHISFSSLAWTDGPKHKALNVYLLPGSHLIRLERLYHPGLPYIRSIQLIPSTNLSGKVNIKPNADRMVFRSGDEFTIHMSAEKQSSSNTIVFSIIDAFTSKIVHTVKQAIPEGTGQFEVDINLPTNQEGIFNVEARHLIYGQVARKFQYVIIDTKTGPPASFQTEKKLIRRINPTKSLPDYRSDNLTVITDDKLGRYLESVGNGVYGNRDQPDYFAYKLEIPDVTGFYLAEIDFPDNAPRAFTISLVDTAVNPYALDSGVVTGGHYPLTHKIQTSRIYFHAREQAPRLLFLNWHTGKRIAVSEIRLYRLNDNSLPVLTGIAHSDRKFGMFYEEPMRFTSYFGAKPSGNQWTEIYTTAQRWAEWSLFVGQNLWLQSIANYQHVMWPTNLLPGYVPSDEDAFSLLGPVSPYDFHEKDIIRLLLLMAEKYNISFIGELAIPATGYIKMALDEQFSGDSYKSSDKNVKPWLIVSDQGDTGGQSPFKPYFNPVHPKVQEWVKDIIRELALRYKDSPGFDGLAIRLMGWSFASWQAFPSIHWGYGDFTINKFEQETGIKIPVSMRDPDRFNKRYEWLIKNRYQDWVDWRCATVAAFYKNLHSIMKAARPDLKLYINAFGPDYSQSDWSKMGGWRARYRKLEKLGLLDMLRESGVDPRQFENDSEIIFSNSFPYPPGIRAQSKAKGELAEELASLEWKEATDPESITLSTKRQPAGSVAAVRFGNAYMEYNLPVKWIGYDHLQWRKSKTLRIAAAMNPAGRGAVSRYAWALAEGNITNLIDGGLGYAHGDPYILRRFMREYHCLPGIGMTKLPEESAVALWYGYKNGETYIYLVNRIGYRSEAIVRLAGPGKLGRVTTGDIFTTNNKHEFNVHLEPYDLIVLKSDGMAVKPISLSTVSP